MALARVVLDDERLVEIDVDVLARRPIRDRARSVRCGSSSSQRGTVLRVSVSETVLKYSLPRLDAWTGDRVARLDLSRGDVRPAAVQRDVAVKTSWRACRRESAKPRR